MTNIIQSKHPVLKSIGIAFIPVFAAIISGTIISIKKLDDLQSILVQTLLFSISIILGLVLIRKSKIHYTDVGLNSFPKYVNKKLLYWVPLILIEATTFIVGFKDKSIVWILALLPFVICVGVNQELYFRGIVLNILKKLGNRKAIIISAMLFGVLHSANLLAGKEPIFVFEQVIFALVFGVVAAEIVIITKSLLPVIIWHVLHDFIGFITNDCISNTALIILTFQIIVLILFSIFLWKKLSIKIQ
ncbi:MAG TPA: CPBP family intramembrane glutamic endopeptidase [Oscillospiraceae bacterium]|nr:CPBP family intramembrane glutamic endopeptidase [Oscillospiraceae bacterium]